MYIKTQGNNRCYEKLNSATKIGTSLSFLLAKYEAGYIINAVQYFTSKIRCHAMSIIVLHSKIILL